MVREGRNTGGKKRPVREKLGPQGFKLEKEVESSYQKPQNTLSMIYPQVYLPFGPHRTISLLEKDKLLLLTADWYVNELHLGNFGVVQRILVQNLGSLSYLLSSSFTDVSTASFPI